MLLIQRDRQAMDGDTANLPFDGFVYPEFTHVGHGPLHEESCAPRHVLQAIDELQSVRMAIGE